MFTIDLGSGNTCQNDIIKVRDMLFAVEEIDKDKKIILKWQLFKEATPNIPPGCHRCEGRGYEPNTNGSIGNKEIITRYCIECNGLRRK